ncbi:MAG TPA: hypothetical protein VK459_21300, partial [Polyangiaceae bacterium]|nr:hypothetical protein [Polyangiaceae bacterium]
VAAYDWDPAFPIDMVRVAAALPEGVVIGPEEGASVAEVDGCVAWVIDRKWAWPWRWGETKVWPDVMAASADPAAPASLQKKFGKRAKAPEPTEAPAKAKARVKAGAWPPEGGALDEIAELLATGIRGLGDGYHANDYRREYAVRTMALGMFDRAAAAIEASEGWPAWSDPWIAAYAHGEAAVAALTSAAPRTEAQAGRLRKWLAAAESLMKKKAAKEQSLCRPLAMVGAAWVLLGDATRGEKALAEAIRTIDPETNSTEHRRVVAEALAAVGRVREAIEHLTSAEDEPSWTETPAAFAAIVPRASAAELAYLFARLRAVEGHDKSDLLDRGVRRWIALREWDAAVAWVRGFGISTLEATVQLAAAMVTAGEVARAEALVKAIDPADNNRAEVLLELARLAPEFARGRLEALVAAAPRLVAKEYWPGEFVVKLAGAAARLGRLDVAAKIEALGRDASEQHEARLAVLAEADPADPAWATWFARARAKAPRDKQLAVRLAALAHRGGLVEARDELLAQAMTAAREASSADLALEEVSRRMAEVG